LEEDAAAEEEALKKVRRVLEKKARRDTNHNNINSNNTASSEVKRRNKRLLGPWSRVTLLSATVGDPLRKGRWRLLIYHHHLLFGFFLERERVFFEAVLRCRTR
jgi:hypothetical protein